jgi:AraC-like DNA-binding protein
MAETMQMKYRKALLLFCILVIRSSDLVLQRYDELRFEEIEKKVGKMDNLTIHCFFITKIICIFASMKKQKDGFQGERKVVLPPMIVEMERNDSLVSSLYVTDIGYFPQAAHHFCERKDPIGQYVLIYCVEGSGWYRVASKEYQVTKGQFFILPPYQPHAYGTSEDQSWTIYWLHFSGAHAAIYAEGMQMPQNIKVAMNSRIMYRISIFEELLTTLQSGTLEDLRYASSLLHHFLASMRYLGQFRRAKAEAPTDIVDQAIHYMRENIENRMMMDDVLRYVGYSQSHFNTLFKKKAGMSPITYFNRLKIEHACRLLRTTDMKINMICYKVGIEDPLYFSRLFSKLMGMSPTDYRLKERQ